MSNASEDAIEILKELINIDYTKTGIKSDKKYYVNGEGIYTCYRYFTKDDLKNDLDIKSSNQQEVIINFETREVISVQGKTYDGITYHRLQDMN